MNANILMFVICVEAIMHMLLYNLHDCTFKIFLCTLCVKEAVVFVFLVQWLILVYISVQGKIKLVVLCLFFVRVYPVPFVI